MRDVRKRWSAPKLLLCLTCALLGILIDRWSYARAFEWKTYDLRVRWMAARDKPSRDIVIVALDNRSLTRLEPAVGRWPWPRAVFAGVLDYCSGAVAVGMDLLFTEADWQYPPSDDVLAKEARRHGAIASAVYFDHRSEPPMDLHEISKHALPAIRPSELHIPAYPHFTAPYPSLLDATARLGHVNYMPDDDGVVRSHMVLAQACGQVYPSMAVALVMIRDRLSPTDVWVLPGGRLAVGTHEVRLDRDGGLSLRLIEKPYATYSIADVLDSWKAELHGEEPAIPREVFDGKIVLIGSTATGLESDNKLTSISPTIAGIRMTAMAVDNILRSRSFTRCGETLSGLATLALCLLLGGVSHLAKPVALLAAGATIFILYVVVVMAVMEVHGYVIPLTPTLTALLFTTIGLGTLYWRQESRHRQQLERVETAKQLFTDMLVHDMKVHIAPILIAGSRLSKAHESDPSSLHKLYDMVGVNARRLAVHVNALLDIRTMQEGRLIIETTARKIEDLLAEAVSDHLSSAKLLGMRLVLDWDDSKNVPILVDTAIFERVMANLIWNALKYGEKGGDIGIAYRVLDEQRIEITVSNRGRAIPPADRGMLFEPFVSEIQEGRELSSAGLGLAFCRLAVEAHGGAISVDSPWTEDGTGVRVRIVLPLSDMPGEGFASPSG